MNNVVNIQVASAATTSSSAQTGGETAGAPQTRSKDGSKNGS